jgi:hypothetical protein
MFVDNFQFCLSSCIFFVACVTNAMRLVELVDYVRPFFPLSVYNPDLLSFRDWNTFLTIQIHFLQNPAGRAPLQERGEGCNKVLALDIPVITP